MPFGIFMIGQGRVYGWDAHARSGALRGPLEATLAKGLGSGQGLRVLTLEAALLALLEAALLAVLATALALEALLLAPALSLEPLLLPLEPLLLALEPLLLALEPLLLLHTGTICSASTPGLILTA